MIDDIAEKGVPFATSFLKRQWNRVNNREDSELEQAGIRFIMVAAFVVYFSFESDPSVHAVRRIAVAYEIVCLVYVGWIVAQPVRNPLRRILAMVSDFAYASYLIHIGGESVSIFFWLYPWVILGNGFRYGAAYLVASVVVASIGFTVAVLTTPFWLAHPRLDIGLLLGLIAVPVYAVTLIRRLTRAKAMAEEASHAKSRFLAVVSHELRTPLHAIIGTSELLSGVTINDDQAEMAGTIRLSGQSLLSLIDSVLDFSRIEAGKTTIALAGIDLHRSLAELITVLRPQAAAKCLRLTAELTAEVPPAIEADWPHIRQILTNLIANAIKFTESGGVDLKVSFDAGRLIFDVEDTGIGISVDKLETIFEAFVQADDGANRRHGGSGLGLAIAQQLAHLMDGDIAVESQPGVGSRFRFAMACRPTPFTPAFPLPVRLVILARAWRPPRTLIDLAQDYMTIGAAAETVDAWHGPDLPGVLAVEGAAAQGAEALILSAQDAGIPILSIGAWPEEWLPPLGRLHPDAPIEHWASLVHAGMAFGSPAKFVPETAERPIASLFVLVAEDDLINIKVIRRILENAGHRIAVVRSGDALLAAMGKGTFDLVISDVNMPGMTLIEVISLYKMGLPEKPIPVIALSADATTETRKACMDAGVDAYVTKPATQAVLFAAMARLIHLPEPRILPAGPKVTDLTSHPSFQRPSVPTVDRRTVDSLLDLGGLHYLEELLDDFTREAELLIEALETSARAGDRMRFRSERHALRSGAANLGARMITTLCKPGPIDLNDLADKGPQFCERLRRELTLFQTDVVAYARNQRRGPDSGAGS